jgi:hypothetical protein
MTARPSPIGPEQQQSRTEGSTKLRGRAPDARLAFPATHAYPRPGIRAGDEPVTRQSPFQWRASHRQSHEQTAQSNIVDPLDFEKAKGWGMGRPSSWYGPSCEGTHSVDLAYLRRNQMLVPGYNGSLIWRRGDSRTGSVGVKATAHGITLTYSSRRLDGDTRHVNELIPFSYTPTRFGGRRQWFLCLSCRKNCRVIYGSGTYFRCRECCHLRYASQHQPAYQRAIDRANRIRRKMSDDRGSAFSGDPLPLKPPRMRAATYSRLCREYEIASRAWCAGVTKRFDLFRETSRPRRPRSA